jgi:hypothetical protein
MWKSFAIGVGSAVAIFVGAYAGAAILETELGRTLIAAMALFVGVAAVVQSARVFGRRPRYS